MIMIDIGNLLVVFNATANFFIYISFSQAYRVALKGIFQKRSKMSKVVQTLLWPKNVSDYILSVPQDFIYEVCAECLYRMKNKCASDYFIISYLSFP